ncbi:hypothetical protein EDB87DRAFT_278536 [Lactarius vividus]|nr:hypothetical protein EDB87DRAFT_278536 [Lactarius vividus]
MDYRPHLHLPGTGPISSSTLPVSADRHTHQSHPTSNRVGSSSSSYAPSPNPRKRAKMDDPLKFRPVAHLWCLPNTPAPASCATTTTTTTTATTTPATRPRIPIWFLPRLLLPRRLANASARQRTAHTRVVPFTNRGRRQQRRARWGRERGATTAPTADGCGCSVGVRVLTSTSPTTDHTAPFRPEHGGPLRERVWTRGRKRGRSRSGVRLPSAAADVRLAAVCATDARGRRQRKPAPAPTDDHRRRRKRRWRLELVIVLARLFVRRR